MKLDDSIAAVVTGGASGLGAATARELAGTGVRVAILDLDEERASAVASEVGGVACSCDVTDVDSVAKALAAARAAHGQERILVNCAGIAAGEKTARRDRKTGEVGGHDLGRYAKVINVNLVGTFNVITQMVTGLMQEDPVTDDGGRGVIVNTSSVAAQDGQVGQVAYAASKGGIAAMSLPIARDLSREGIRCMAIMPGIFDTPMFASVTDEVRANLEASVPFPSRLGDPGEYGRLVRHIAENEMLNGTTIRLDGAIRLP